jgi:hypothetical protein
MNAEDKLASGQKIIKFKKLIKDANISILVIFLNIKNKRKSFVGS